MDEDVRVVIYLSNKKLAEPSSDCLVSVAVVEDRPDKDRGRYPDDRVEKSLLHANGAPGLILQLASDVVASRLSEAAATAQLALMAHKRTLEKKDPA